jgi:hypothetical protein
MTSQGRKTKTLLRGLALTALVLGLSGCYYAPPPPAAYYGSPYYGGGYYAPYAYYPGPYYYGPSVGFVYRGGGGRWR